MTLDELRCPSCTAPVEASRGELTVCRYCGATLVRKEPPTARTEERFFVSLRVGPSNLERVARVLAECAAIEGSEARALVTHSPCEIPAGSDEGHARHLARAVSEAGAQAEVTTRMVAIPLVDVLLDGAGGNKLAVIVAIREHLTLSVTEAKRLVEAAPCVVVARMDEPKAQALVAALQAAGASARAFGAVENAARRSGC